MRKSNIFISFIFVLLLTACKDEAEITVTNNIKNIRLESVSYGDEIGIASSLLPGEKGNRSIDDKMKTVSFPMNKQFRFYMVKGDNRVLLYTKEYYTVDEDEHLDVTLSDDTEVINPMDVSAKKNAVTTLSEFSKE